MHNALPLAVLNVSSAQATHSPPSGPVKPGLQRQAATAVLELAEFELVGQVVHVLDVVPPIAPECVPAPQLVHTAAPPVEYFPATQSVHIELPTVVANLPATHVAQAPAAVAPVVAKDVPAAQSIHTELPAAVVYLPTGHVTQAPCAVTPVTAEYVPAPHAVHVPPLVP